MLIRESSFTRRRRRIRYRTVTNNKKKFPRLTVHVSNKYIYASLIDDATGSTLFSLSTSFNKTDIGCTVPAARELGLACANKAQSLGINSIVFDRSGYAYHGRVKALAEGAREGSLVF